MIRRSQYCHNFPPAMIWHPARLSGMAFLEPLMALELVLMTNQRNPCLSPPNGVDLAMWMRVE